MFGQRIVNKEAIIAEYLAGGITYRRLAEKHGIDFRTINYWVLSYQGKKAADKMGAGKTATSKTEQEPLPIDVQKLQKELKTSKLQNALLNAMIDTAEEHLKINIRKKSGTRQ
jgi:transposase-like protein